MTHRFAYLLCCMLMAGPVQTLAQRTDVQLENAWSRAAMQGRTGVVYLTIVDNGAADKLTEIVSPTAAKAELHESFTEDGIAKMRPVAVLPVDPGKPVILAPGGYHIMLINLRQSLKPGDMFPITLRFEKAGEVSAQVTVQGPAGSKPVSGHSVSGRVP